MPQSYGHIYLHVVFSTKSREAILTNALHQEFARYITPILASLKSVCIAEGGMPDHVHLLIDLGRESSVSKVLREIKSKSSAWLHKKLQRKFSWQIGYGVFSVSPSHVKNVIRYIEHQEEHHRSQTFEREFESILTSAGVEYDPKYLWIEEGDDH